MVLASAIELSESASLWSVEALVAVLALTLMEIVLGIDNIVFIAILTGRLPEKNRSFARRVGLVLAMLMRIVLLFAIGGLMGLTAPLFELSSLVPAVDLLFEDPEINEVSGRDVILFLGGLFLLYTAVREIHHKVEGDEPEREMVPPPDGESGGQAPRGISLGGVLFRISFMDVIFSLDSVLTAVGMANHIEIMVAAVVASIAVMITFANQISDFVQEHPTVKILALSFLILISVVLISDAAGTPLNKGYVYFAMAFSLAVEFLNLRMQLKRVRPSEGGGETGTVR